MATDATHDSPAIHTYAKPNHKEMDLGERHGPGSAHVHVVPIWLLLAVYAALLVLTVLTVAVTKIPFGIMNVWVALGIAVAKASLVALFFMHLRWDSPFNGIVLILSFFFVAFFIGISVLDTKEYQHFENAPSSAIHP